jgi:hypothetical protein
MYNNQCYNFKKLEFSEGIIDNCVDVTYIIHLEGNGRLDHIYEQLNTFHITKQVFILFNKGFNRCAKRKYVDKPPIDLVDAFFSVMEHAEKNNYKNILILEDDFIFSDEIVNPNNINEINTFINKNSEESFIYLLGCLPYLQIPFSYYNRLLLLKSGTHACIYSKNMRKNILQKNKDEIDDWDIFTNIHCKKYIFYKPLCYQLFPETENKKYWIYIPLLSDINTFFKNLFNMDKVVEPGYSYYYWFSFLLFFVACFLFLSILYFIISFAFFIYKPFMRNIIKK